MKINPSCICFIDSCWRHGICQLCLNNHNNNAASLNCKLDEEAYKARKARWESLQDEPKYPVDSEVGILSKYAQETVKTAVLNYKECIAKLEAIKALAESDAVDLSEIISEMENLGKAALLACQQTSAAIKLAEAVNNSVKEC